MLSFSFRSEYSLPGSEFPEGVSVGSFSSSAESIQGTTRHEKPPSAKMYKDITEAMEACSKSDEVGRFAVKWINVRKKLMEKNAFYASLTPYNIRDKYKYLKRMKKF